MEQALDILKKYWGYEAFRSPQDAIIQSVLDGKDTLALMPTGGGKSVSFQVPALLQEGICIVVSPLVALMTDQVEALKRRDIRALSLAGGLSHNDLERLLGNALYGNYKFLYLSPERLQQEAVREAIRQMSVNLIAIDEAHCVSHWGKDFRPAYLECKWLKETFPAVPMLALTASATPKVQKDIIAALTMQEPHIITTSLQRRNISYEVMEVEDKLFHLLQTLKLQKGSAIIYLRSRSGTVQMANFLEGQGISATFFHGGLTADEKNKKLGMWLTGDIRVMVATNAFGMGIDKPDVRTVVHWDIPSTLEDYFQEAGRAGRDGKPSTAVLFYNELDLKTSEQQLHNNLVDLPYLKYIYGRLNAYFVIAIGEGEEQTFGLLFPELCKRYNLQAQKAYNALLVLDRCSVISLSENFHHRSSLFFKIESFQLMEYLKAHSHLKDLVLYLIRSFTGIYNRPISLRIEALAEQLHLNYKTVIEQLEQLQKDDVAEFVNKEADLELTFRVPRDDDRTIDAIAKSVREYNHTKTTLQMAVYDYINNESECRSMQLLRYFGQNDLTPCGRCSVCQKKHAKGYLRSEEASQ